MSCGEILTGSQASKAFSEMVPWQQSGKTGTCGRVIGLSEDFSNVCVLSLLLLSECYLALTNRQKVDGLLPYQSSPLRLFRYCCTSQR